MGVIIDNEISKAWEMLKKKKSKKESDIPKESAEEKEKPENLEESLIPKEKEEFISILPEKASSLEIERNLEATVGMSSKIEKEEEKEEKISYLAKPSEEERKYESPIISLSEFTPIPKIFEKAELAEIAKEKVFMPKLQVTFEKEYTPFEEIKIKQLDHEMLERERKEKIKKYKPAM
ncbi:MAG: hypothetical protein QW041_02705 [Candidatus Pacearchaeota archaeon]